jgi:hypothetical protein
MTDPAFDALMAQAEAHKRGALAIWTIYRGALGAGPSPSDGFIACMHEVHDGSTKATDKIVTGELEDIRKIFWQAGLLKLSRSEGDEPQIVESWV